MKFRKLLGDRILVKLEPEKKVSGDIILPDSYKEPLRLGVITQVGPGTRVKVKQKDGKYKDKFRPMEAQVGDRVAFLYASTEFGTAKSAGYYLEDDERLLCETDILFVVEERGEVDICR